MEIKNNVELIQLLQRQLEEVVNFVLEKMLDELQKELRNQDFEPTRSGSFFNAWNLVKAKAFGRYGMSGELFYNPSEMDLQNGTNFPWIHGSPLRGRQGGSAPNDVREGMADILFKGLAPAFLTGQSGNLPPRDAWTPFLNTVEREFDNWVHQGMIKVGMNPSSGSFRYR